MYGCGRWRRVIRCGGYCVKFWLGDYWVPGDLGDLHLIFHLESELLTHYAHLYPLNYKVEVGRGMVIFAERIFSPFYLLRGRSV